MEEKDVNENVTDSAKDIDDTDDEFLKKTKKTFVLTIITVIVALIAIGSVIYVIVLTGRNSDNNRYNPSATETEALTLSAQELLKNNYDIIRMFYEEGLSITQMTPVDESKIAKNSSGAKEMKDYKVETDNVYTVDDETYKTYDQIKELVYATLSEQAADDLLTNGQGAGPVYCDKDGALAIDLNAFQPIEYDKNWASVSCEYKNITSDTADVFVTLPYTEKSDKAGQSVTLSGNLVKTANGWRLDKLIY